MSDVRCPMPPGIEVATGTAAEFDDECINTGQNPTTDQLLEDIGHAQAGDTPARRNPGQAFTAYARG